MTLDVAISTYRPEGIERVAAMYLPEIPDVRYVVSWQAHNGAVLPPALAARRDVEVHRFDSMGQSHNRNNALRHCRADIVLMSDDDLTYTDEGLKAVIRAFEDNPDVNVATFRSRQTAIRIYPDSCVRLHRRLPRGYYVTTFEIACRRTAIGSMRFCPELGLNSPMMHGGEDEMFLMAAIRRGLNCRFFPITICAHPHESTGTKSRLTAANLRAAGCVIALSYGLGATLRVPLKAWRVYRKGQAPLLKALRHLTRGALMAPGVLRRNHDSLW
ncbi:MAG: glycosyltransferase [Muribaculaceae bacterium]|nr:glycosyltransferase [Muribaculaceae bacterium]